MAITFNLELASKPNRKGHWPVRIRITQDRKLTRIQTSVELNKQSDWNKAKQRISNSEPNHAVWNDILDKELEVVKSKYRKLREDGAVSAESVKEAVINDGKTESFLAFAEKCVQEFENAGQLRSADKLNGAVNKIKKFQTNKRGVLRDLKFSELTPVYVAEFDDFLHTLPNEVHPEQRLHQNSIATVLRQFRTLINKAIKLKLLRRESDPFYGFSIKEVPTKKDKLNDDEISAIRDLLLPQDSLISHVRDVFMFAYYCAGIRVNDILQLRWINISDGRLDYEMGKNRKGPDFLLVDEALSILSKYKTDDANLTDYIFPFLSNTEDWSKAITQKEKDILPPDVKRRMFNQIEAKTALINKYLKKIAAKAGIEKSLSSHISRHSFASKAKREGVDNLAVKELLKHSNLKTTERYMGAFDHAKTDAALQSVFHHTTQGDAMESVKKGPTDQPQWKFCPECGTKLDGNFKFCPGCGMKLK